MKLKALLVGFNLLGLNPSLRIAHVLWNYRVWRGNVFPLYFSLLHFLGAGKTAAEPCRGWRGVRALKGLQGSAALLDREMCGYSKMRSEEMSDARRLRKL